MWANPFAPPPLKTSPTLTSCPCCCCEKATVEIIRNAIRRRGFIKSFLDCWIIGLLKILFIIHYSLFIIHYSLFIIHYSLFIIHYSLFIIHYSLFIIHYLLLIIHYFLLFLKIYLYYICAVFSYYFYK